MKIEISDDKIGQIARKGHAAMAREEQAAYSVGQVKRAFTASFPVLLNSILSTSDTEISDPAEERALHFNEALGLKGVGLRIVSLWDADDLRRREPAGRPASPTIEDILVEGLFSEPHLASELQRAAVKAHAVLEDREAYSIHQVELALLGYLPVVLSRHLSEITEWAQGAKEQRPHSFNQHLELALQSDI